MPNANVTLVTVTPTGRSSSGLSIQVKPDGQFIASGVTPGQDAIQVSIGNWWFSNPEDKRDEEMGYVPVRVDAANIDGVVVATSKAVKVAGRIGFEGGIPNRQYEAADMTTPDEFGGGRIMFGPPSPATVRDDMSFELDGLFGPQLLMVMGTPRGWIVKSVRYRGDDVTDRAVEFRSSSDPRLLEVSLTNQGAIVTGRVLGDDDKVSSDVSVVSCLQMCRGGGRSLDCRRSDQVGRDVHHRTGAGRRVLVAVVTGMSMTKLLVPSARAEVAERIAKAGQRIVRVKTQKHSIDLRIAKLQ